MSSSKYVEYVKTMDYVERMNSSANGNPRYRIHFTDGTVAATEVDGSVAYGLENRSNFAGPVRVKAHARSGNVWSIEPVSGTER